LFKVIEAGRIVGDSKGIAPSIKYGGAEIRQPVSRLSGRIEPARSIKRQTYVIIKDYGHKAKGI
jgi:hypothetical protein